MEEHVRFSPILLEAHAPHQHHLACSPCVTTGLVSLMWWLRFPIPPLGAHPSFAAQHDSLNCLLTSSPWSGAWGLLACLPVWGWEDPHIDSPGWSPTPYTTLLKMTLHFLILPLPPSARLIMGMYHHAWFYEAKYGSYNVVHGRQARY